MTEYEIVLREINEELKNINMRLAKDQEAIENLLDQMKKEKGSPHYPSSYPYHFDDFMDLRNCPTTSAFEEPSNRYK